MSDTDIYKNRERLQTEPTPTRSRKGRRRRSASRTAFDDTGNRRRRSKNSGFRRLLHLSRRTSNEKSFWWGLIVAVVVLMLALAVWQFWWLERVAREQARQDALYVPIQSPETTPASASE